MEYSRKKNLSIHLLQEKGSKHLESAFSQLRAHLAGVCSNAHSGEEEKGAVPSNINQGSRARSKMAPALNKIFKEPSSSGSSSAFLELELTKRRTRLRALGKSFFFKFSQFFELLSIVIWLFHSFQFYFYQYNPSFVSFRPVSYTHLTLPTIYSV